MRHMRRRFMWRIGCAFVVFLLVIVGLAALVISLVASLLGGNAGTASTVLIGLAVIFVVVMAARGVRRAARPVGDLVEAAGRIEEGDLGARVPERGPREVRALARAFNAMSERLEATETERRRLLADVSHELRTPLTVIQGNLEAVLDGIYPADAEHLRPILEETHLMERLIEDLRLLSLAEAGAMGLEREPTDLVALANDVVSGFRAQADGSGITLWVAAPSPVPELEVDPVRIRAVLSNLLANAIRHTPAGGTVTVTMTRDAARLSVAVEDSGSGIEPAALAGIFDRFSRAPDSPGSGLGLAIARALVQAHGGEISATSTLGQGTTVRFTLPIASRSA
jgi:signal transduction histidine kinase